MAGYDAKDSTSVDIKVENYSSKLSDKAKGLKIGIPKEYRVDNMPSEIDKLWKKGVDYFAAYPAIAGNNKAESATFFVIGPA